MKKIMIGLLACGALLQAGAEELQWMTDLPKAQEKAKAENKLVMLDFTGSDWCGWCIKLNKEVFSKAEFADFAAKNLVLVEVDFPTHKTLAAEQKRANDALLKKYKVEGYPTIIVLNSAGKKVGELGYEPGGPKAFISKLEELKKKT
jgi:thioredoxin-related protein